MRISIKTAAVRLSLVFICTISVMVFTTPVAFAKYASIVIDADNGRVLHQVNPHTRNYPASLTKMMTLYLLFDELQSGHLQLNDRLRVSARAARQPSSRMGVRKGERISVQQAILALTVKSANDVAVVIAEAISGNQRDFALHMTAMAHKMGMNRTTFRNPSGLPHRGQMSTARDMSVLAYRLMKDFPQYYHYFSVDKFTYKGRTYKNHNRLLKNYQGTDGIKTGYIRASGYNLVTSVERGGKRLIGVIFGGNSAKARDRRMISLLNKAFKMVGVTTLVTNTIRKKAKKVVRYTRTGNISKYKRHYENAWAIQVGAYKQYQPAYDIARKVRDKIYGVLKGSTIKVVPLKKRNRHNIYRARLQGLNKKQAYSACGRLRYLGMDCMEIRMRGMQLALVK